MKINVLFFGQLTDITGTDNVVLENISDTASLKIQLNKSYPGLDTKKYILAIDTQMVTENTTLPDNCQVALLPPFSGG